MRDLMDRLRVVGAVLLMVGSSGAVWCQDADTDGAAVQLRFVAAPAAESGLTHVANSEPRWGAMKYMWMSPPVDIDGDGHLDLLLYGHHGGGAAVWLGKGDGTFTLDERGYQQRWVFGARDPVWWDRSGRGAVDGLGTEGAGVSGFLFVNDGTGHWRKTAAAIPEAGYGSFQLADLNGDGWHREIFLSGRGAALRPNLPPADWADVLPKSLHFEEDWTAEQLVGWPKQVELGRGPARSGYRDAYAVDLTGDHQNELILHLRGSGFSSPQLYSWVLTRSVTADGGFVWKDTTAERGLPTDEGHWLFPEDVDVDGHLDLVDLHTGHWYRNDGKGRFTVSPHRVFDPKNRTLAGKKGHPWTTDNELQWLDLDNNGFRDLVTASDHGSENGVFLNLGGGRFVEVAGVPGNRRNRKFGDLTGNQRLDMVALVQNQLVLHRNETPLGGLHIRLEPREPADVHLGAKVWVYRAGQLGEAAGLLHYRQGFMERDAGRSTVLTPLLHVGLGQAEAADVRVRFSSGVIREVRGVKAGTRVVVREAEGERQSQ